ncbi:MAG: thiamine pyrophosphate-binding protein [Bradymonadaceae bacterium]
MSVQHGGDIIAERLKNRGIPYIFTLCGGHISPILTGARALGIDVIDVRDEATAVFAADAVARMTGLPGVAAVTAGPGVTNTITAIKNAQMAQSPVLLFGGTTPTLLKGRGALQDIDQLTLMRPLTKWAVSLKTIADLGPAVDRALEIATTGVPGPVFIEVPVDLLYPEEIVREWFIKESGVKETSGIGARALELYLQAHLLRQFKSPHLPFEFPMPSLPLSFATNVEDQIDKVADMLRHAERPALVVGSQALVNMTPAQAENLAEAIRDLGIPAFLGGTARGLLGQHSDIQFRHKRTRALKESDLAIIAGFPFDFRMGYGRVFGSRTRVVSANLSSEDLTKNRRPDVGLLTHPGEFLMGLADRVRSTSSERATWFTTLKGREDARDQEIAALGEDTAALAEPELVNPMQFFKRLEEKMADDAVIVVDGGDFVATGAYILRPRAPLSWLDPGVFGTLGVGGGFAVGAALCRPDAEIWLIYGDGSSGYSLAEFDTCVRHGLAPIAVIGNDGSWAQIARDQVEILGDDVATTLLRCDYHKVAKGYGAEGILVTKPSQVDRAIDRAKKLAASGKPVVINMHISGTDFRKGSISM